MEPPKKLSWLEMIQLFQQLYALYREMEKDGTIKEVMEGIEAVRHKFSNPRTKELIGRITEFFKKG